MNPKAPTNVFQVQALDAPMLIQQLQTRGTLKSCIWDSEGTALLTMRDDSTRLVKKV